jgi:hypothetical protein
VLASFVDAGGEIWACGACAGPRGITDNHLIKGARIVTDRWPGGGRGSEFAARTQQRDPGGG